MHSPPTPIHPRFELHDLCALRRFSTALLPPSLLRTTWSTVHGSPTLSPSPHREHVGGVFSSTHFLLARYSPSLHASPHREQNAVPSRAILGHRLQILRLIVLLVSNLPSRGQPRLPSPTLLYPNSRELQSPPDPTRSYLRLPRTPETPETIRLNLPQPVSRCSTEDYRRLPDQPSSTELYPINRAQPELPASTCLKVFNLVHPRTTRLYLNYPSQPCLPVSTRLYPVYSDLPASTELNRAQPCLPELPESTELNLPQGRTTRTTGVNPVYRGLQRLPRTTASTGDPFTAEHRGGSIHIHPLSPS